MGLNKRSNVGQLIMQPQLCLHVKQIYSYEPIILFGGFLKFVLNTIVHSSALKTQEKQTAVWIDCCLFVAEQPDHLRSALHGVFSWLCLLERVIVPALSVFYEVY